MLGTMSLAVSATCVQAFLSLASPRVHNRLTAQVGHPQQFRHTFVKRLLIAGVPVGTVAILLGHGKVAITEKHYSRWITERQAVVDAAVRGSWKD